MAKHTYLPTYLPTNPLQKFLKKIQLHYFQAMFQKMFHLMIQRRLYYTDISMIFLLTAVALMLMIF